MNYNNHDIRTNTTTLKQHAAARKRAAGATAKPTKTRRIMQTAAAFLLAAGGANADVVLQPNEAMSKDAKTYGFLPANNFQSNLSVIGADFTPHEFRSLVQFDLSALSLSPEEVSGATLELWVPTVSAAGDLSLHDVTGTWAEIAVTWNSFPAFAPAPVATQLVDTAGVWVTFDVSSSVLAWLASPSSNNGLALIPAAGTDLVVSDADGVTGASPDPTKAPRLTIHTSKELLVQSGDIVPGIADTTFKSIGVPAINDGGDVAVLGKYSGGSTILVNGDRVLTTGDSVFDFAGNPFAGVTVKSMKDPVISPDGILVFAGTIAGTGVSSANDSAVLAADANTPGGGIVVAQEGSPAPGASSGTVFRSFLSAASPGAGTPALVLAKLTGGDTTSQTDEALYAYDGAISGMSLVLREGVSIIRGKTVKKFTVLKAVAGTPGQTHAFNSSGHLVCKVQFTDNSQAAVLVTLPSSVSNE